MLSSFLGQRGYEDDDDPGMDGLKVDVVAVVGMRGLDGEGKGILDFIGDAGREDGKAEGRGRGTEGLWGLGVIAEGTRGAIRD
jgi:hypothetical protein